jgi:hypothetical protein
LKELLALYHSELVEMRLRVDQQTKMTAAEAAAQRAAN